MTNRWSSIALLLAGATVLGATVFRAPIARAAQDVSAIIIGPLDANGNVRVHEQGTVGITAGSTIGAQQTGDWSVTVGNLVAAYPALPPTAFNIVKKVSGIPAVKLFDVESSQRWNITSLAVANSNDSPQHFALVASICNPGGPGGTTPMVAALVRAQDTLTFTFPVPAFQNGTCLYAQNYDTGELDFTVIGFRTP